MCTPAAAFEAFSTATTFRGITNAFFQLCLTLDVDPTDHKNVYESIHQLDCWKAQKLFKLLDKRRQQAEYRGNEAAPAFNVMVIGAGPCGLRAAIECALLGCRTVVLEARDKFSRNNVLHLWEFVIADLKGLGAKFFYPKFCTGSIEHISIRQLQCTLLKVALLFGVQVYDSVSFKQLLLPTEETPVEGSGYRALLEPADHILSSYEFDVLIGADGKRNTVPGFPREEMRGKLAIGITVNFVNKKSYEEERVPEISGVAYIFNQTFFKEMYEVTGVSLENIVYYKDETHYFVMCAKKSSLLEQGVIKNDCEDVSSLLAASNVDDAALCRFAAAAADFATKSKLPTLDFALNQRSRPDVAMFDFTSLFSAKCSVRMVRKAGRSLLMAIVGDSLHEPFWPTGSGCARGFLGVWDTAWLIRQLAVSGRDEMELIAERESVYRLLAQVTKDNMHKNMSKYTIDPRTRYISLDLNMRAEDVRMLVWGDEGECATLGAHCQSRALAHLLSCHRFALHTLAPYKMKMNNLTSCWRDGRGLGALLAKFLPDALEYLQLLAMDGEQSRIERCLSIIADRLGLTTPRGEWKTLADDVLMAFVANVLTVIRSDADRARRAITPKAMSLKRRSERPPVDASRARKAAPIERLAQDVMACYEGRSGGGGKMVEGNENLATPSRLADRTALVPPMRSYTKRPLVERLNPELVLKVEQIVTGERVKEEERQFYKEREAAQEKAAQRMSREELTKMGEKMAAVDRGDDRERRRENMSGQEEKLMRARVADVRREAEGGFTRKEEMEKYKNVDESLRRSGQRLKQKELAGLPSIRAKPSLPPSPPKKTMTVESAENGEVRMRKLETPSSARRLASLSMVEPAKNACAYCSKAVYLAERVVVEGLTLHRACFKCAFCSQALRLGECTVERLLDQHKNFRMFCKTHARLPLREKLAKIERSERRERGGVMEKASSVDNVDAHATPSLQESTPMSPRRHTVAVDAAVTPTIVQRDKRGGEGEKGLSTRGSSTSLFFFPSDAATGGSSMTSSLCNVTSSSNSSLHPSTATARDGRTTITIGEEDSEVPCPLRVVSASLTEMPTSRSLLLMEEKREEDEYATLERSMTRKLSPSTSMDEEDEEEIEEEEEESGELDLLDTAMDEGDDVEMEEEEEEEELGEEEMEELERTVAEMEDEECTEIQALSIIETINRRRSTVDSRSTVDGRSSSIDEQRPTTVVGTTVTGRNKTMAVIEEGEKELRERKEGELNERRREARERARAKSDRQLGLEEEGTTSSRSSSFSSSSTPPFATPSAAVAAGMGETPRSFAAAAATPSAARLQLDSPSVYTTPLLQTPARPAPYSPPQGLLARLFSPSSNRRPLPSPYSERRGEKKEEERERSSSTSESLDSTVDSIHVESAKESALKGKSYRKMKHSRSTDSRGEAEMSEERRAEVSDDVRGAQTPMAIVAPSPRSVTSGDSISRLSVDDASIRMVQRKVERMRKQRTDDRRRTGQDLQRGLAECDTRMEEVMREGTAAERRLCGDPTSTYLLETWYSLVMERDRLREREDDLRLRAREMAADEEYKGLKKRFNEMSLDGGEEDEDTLLQQMVEALRKRGSARAAVESYRDAPSRPRRDPPHVVLQRHGYNYLNFRPIFIA